MAVLCIVEDNLTSSQNPGLAFLHLPIARSFVGYLFERIKLSKRIDRTIFVTSNSDSGYDEIMSDYVGEYFSPARNLRVPAYHELALLGWIFDPDPDWSEDADTIVRIRVDSPLICPQLIDAMIKNFSDNGADYVSNTITCTFPKGMEVEVYGREALQQAVKHAESMTDPDKVASWISDSGRFKCGDFRYDEDRSKVNLTLKNPKDYFVLRDIIEYFYLQKGRDSCFDYSLEEILHYLDYGGLSYFPST